jgi:phenylacetate-coenzyme A ligase PaaK-like adenylate-forming protein
MRLIKKFMPDPALPNPSLSQLLTAFIEALSTLQASACNANIDGRSLHQHFLTAQQLYQQQLLPTLIESPAAASLVTYQTEINRALRLLAMDVNFLQSAKNPLTQQKRQAQMQQRLKTLLEFSQGLQAALSRTP